MRTELSPSPRNKPRPIEAVRLVEQIQAQVNPVTALGLLDAEGPVLASVPRQPGPL